ncbi:CBO0543 family protein [Bacillus sp. DJP31]|uniref:CBO0543 family protein n=1 Tax=Bacillus sp. DJP31 TaxID=3409789 RepID=UPI003BB55AE9
MGHKFEKKLLRFLLVFGILSFINLMRKPPVKDWVIIFFLKGYIASILDKLVVRKNYITYPVKVFKSFDISFMFDYILFPIFCVYFNQVTEKSKITGIIAKLLLFSGSITVVESWLEKNTDVVKYKKNWNWVKTFSSLSITFLIVRMAIGFIRMYSKKIEKVEQDKRIVE